MKKQKGFTLIELIIVMVVLGILGTIAIPIYKDMRTQTAQVALNSIGGAISSASNMNYQAKLVGAHSLPLTACNLASLGNILAGGMPPPPIGKYDTSGSTLADGVQGTCTLILSSSIFPQGFITTSFPVIGSS